MRKIILSLVIIITLTLSFQNIFAQGKNMRLVGTLNPTPVGYSAVWGYLAPNGREYAILGAVNGTYFIDVTDSTNIHSVGFVSGPTSVWREMKTYSHYAYIVTESAGAGIQIVDLANLPDSIRFVGSFVPAGYSTSHTISQSGPYLYLNGGNAAFGNGVAILDLTVNPEQPVLRGKWNELYIHDSRIVNDTIWAANISDNKMTAINAVNKNNPVTITNWVNGQNPAPHNCALTPGRKYIFVTDETYGPAGRLKVWNIQDLSNIILERVWLPQTFFQNSVIHNVELYGNQLLAAYYSAGVKLLDVSNPPNPVELGWYDTSPANNGSGNGCWGVYMFPSGKIIASDMSKGLFVLRHAPPQNAKPAADFMLEKTINSIADSVQLIDCASNNPTSYQWTITGPLNLTSNLSNPKFKLNLFGSYTVKLKVSNAFGSDSLTKVNYIVMGGTSFQSFSFYSPGVQTIITNRFDTSKVTFTWGKASNDSVFYKFRFNKSGSSNYLYFPSNNNGKDTSVTFTKGRLDSIAHQFGFSGDSVVTFGRAAAYNHSDSAFSNGNLLITLRSTSIGIQNISSQVPDAYKLENNFPNPFNPSTNIKFQLPYNSFVQLIIYDMLGREVVKLLREELNAGYYNYQFNAESFNSGIYFYKLTTEKFSETKRMVLIK